MLDTTKKVLELADIGMLCMQLDSICISHRDSNKEEFEYYNSMLEWLLPKHKFACSEAKITNNLQKEIWEKEHLEWENAPLEKEFGKKYLEAKITDYETQNDMPKEQITYTPKRKKMPFERVINFTVFGYNFFFCLEIDEKG